MRWGAGFGSTGPDAGYAMTLVKTRDFELAEGEHRANANAAVAAVAAARSSLFGRAPTKKDVDLALVLLGYDTSELPADSVADLGPARREWFAAAGHHPERLTAFLSRLEPTVLKLTAEQARSRVAQGERLIAR
jgi:hypothetical protein